jgi:hypothetical protein
VPNSACGRSQDRPKAPWLKTSTDRTAPGPKDGRNEVKAQTKSPVTSPISAPTRVAPRQKMPPIIAGRTWATPRKAISPMAAKAADPPENW